VRGKSSARMKNGRLAAPVWKHVMLRVVQRAIEINRR
jgi:hypothetical protein